MKRRQFIQTMTAAGITSQITSFSRGLTGEKKSDERESLPNRPLGKTGELHNSLKVLRTDYFDLYQLHALTTPDDIKTAFGKDGALEAVEKAKKEGIIRYAGFSSHSVESAMEALENYDFNTVLFPVNFATWYKENFGPQVVEYAKNKGTAVLAIKAMACSVFPEGKEKKYPNCWYLPLSEPEDALLGLRFTL